MINLTQVVVLLKLILILLQSNPTPQTLALASNAVTLANNAIEAQMPQTTTNMNTPNMGDAPVDPAPDIVVTPDVTTQTVSIPAAVQNSNFCNIIVQNPGTGYVQVDFTREGYPELGYINKGTFTINGQTLTMDNWRNGHIGFWIGDLGLATGTSYNYTWHAENDQYFIDGSGTLQL